LVFDVFVTMLNILHSYTPNPIAFNIGSFAIHWYGLFLLIGILIGYWLVGKLAHREDLSKDIVTSLYVNVLIGGLISARIYHVLTDWGFYGSNLDQVLAVWNGGLAIHGAMIGGVLTAFYFVKKHNINFWKIADLFAMAAILGQAIGRWGNYFNQELFGKPISTAWSIPIDAANRPLGFEQFQYFHPTFLYESILNLIIFGILFWVFKKKKRPVGLIFWMYIGLYSLARIIVESFRINEAAMIFGMRLPLLVSVVLLVVAGGMIIRKVKYFYSSS